MKKKLKAWILKQRIKLLHRLLQDEMRRQGWNPDPETAGERWIKAELYEISGKPNKFTMNMTYGEASSKVLKGLPR